jgi:hypothetical protein
MNNTAPAPELIWQIELTETERLLVTFAVCSLNNTNRRYELSTYDQIQLEKLAARFDWNKP